MKIATSPQQQNSFQMTEADSIASEIAGVHLDLLFRRLHDFQLGQTSREQLVEQIAIHIQAMDEVQEIIANEAQAEKKSSAA